MTNKPLILFDGICNLCSGTVHIIRKYDRKSTFEFIPIQEFSDAEKEKYELEDSLFDLDTVVLIINGQVYLKSDAILEIATMLGGMWQLLAIFRLLPKSFRDLLYDLVARYRYTIFGKKDSCKFR